MRREIFVMVATMMMISPQAIAGQTSTRFTVGVQVVRSRPGRAVRNGKRYITNAKHTQKERPK